MGELFSILCAFTWALAVVFMRDASREVNALAFNTYKMGLALILLIPTIWIAGESWQSLSWNSDLWLLIVSGVVGIAVADTLWLKALALIDASTIAIVDCCYSPTVVALSYFFLNESLTSVQAFGCLLVISAIFIVATGKKSGTEQSNRNQIMGIVLAALAVILMAGGIVIVKPILDSVPLFLAIEVRVIAGFVALAFVSLLQKHRRQKYTQLIKGPKARSILIGSFLGSYVAMLLWVAGIKYTSASISAVLNQTSTIFIILFAVIFLKEKLSIRKVVGCVLGIAGVLVVVS